MEAIHSSYALESRIDPITLVVCQKRPNIRKLLLLPLDPVSAIPYDDLKVLRDATWPLFLMYRQHVTLPALTVASQVAMLSPTASQSPPGLLPADALVVAVVFSHHVQCGHTLVKAHTLLLLCDGTVYMCMKGQNYGILSVYYGAPLCMYVQGLIKIEEGGGGFWDLSPKKSPLK